MNAKTEDTDIDLLARCRNGDAAAWRALVHRYERLVYTVGRRAGLDDHGTADLFQTVFARLVEHLPRLRDGSKLQAWIVTTARREVLLLWRRGQRTVSLTPDNDDADESHAFDVADDSPIAEQALDELQQVEGVRRALDAMDARCRDLLMLVFRDDTEEALGYDEVGRRLGMPTGSVGPTRARCLDKLRKLVK
jgi:RNA polymerase sigma factor (sigma-70 family)